VIGSFRLSFDFTGPCGLRVRTEINYLGLGVGKYTDRAKLMPQLLRTKCGLFNNNYFPTKFLPAGRQRVGTVLDKPPCAGPFYFDYIGTGDTHKAYGLAAASPQAPDTLPSTAGSIPVPASATFFYIIFVVTDTACSSTLGPILGQNTGNFYPKGQYAAGGKCNTAVFILSQIQALQRAPNLKARHLTLCKARAVLCSGFV